MMNSLQILFSVASVAFATEEHFKSAYFIVKENYRRSTDQIIKTVGSSSLMTCSQACMRPGGGGGGGTPTKIW